MQKLIDRVLNKERKAEQELCNIVDDKITVFIQRYVQCNETMKDIKQEVLIRVFTKLHQYDSTKGNFGAWIYRITDNCCKKNHNSRTKRNECFLVNNDAVFDFDCYFLDKTDTKNEPIDNNTLTKVKNAMNKLKPGQRNIMNLYLMEGYEHSEIADILNVSINTSKSQLCRGKERIRTLLNN
jgi:RNA polymerase sigma-70 factor (ECF subfamily)